MTNYFYDKINGEFTHSAPAELDLLETEVSGVDFYLRLPNCTQTPPLEEVPVGTVVFNKVANNWEYIEDHRGDEFYLPSDRTKYIMKDLGALPANHQDSIDVELQREDAWTATKALRTKKNYEHILFNGDFFEVMPSSWENLTDAIARLALPNAATERLWLTADNQTVTLSAVDIQTIVANKIDRKDLLHVASQIVRAEIAASSTPADIDIETQYDNAITTIGG